MYDPFYMNGNAEDKWNELGFDCIHPDIDFFESPCPSDENIVVISSPPFSTKLEVFQHLMNKWKLPFIMLMPVSSICHLKMQKIIGNKVQVLIPSLLKGFIKPDGQQAISSPHYYCFITFKMNFSKDFSFI